MPPISFVAGDLPIYTFDTTTVLTFNTPHAVAPGDVLIMIATAESDTTAVDTTMLGAGWLRIARTTITGAMAEVFRRVVTVEEPALHVFRLVAGAFVTSVILAYRGMDASAPAVAAGVALVSSSTSFPCPSESLTSYSDLFIAIASRQSTTGAFTPPSGFIERLDTGGLADDGVDSVPFSVEVSDRLFEAVGPTGVQTSTASSAAHGTACSVVLAAKRPPVAKQLISDVPGAIGFTTIGV